MRPSTFQVVLAALAIPLAGCDVDSLEAAPRTTAGLRPLTEEDVIAWAAVTQGLTREQGPEPIVVGQFRSHLELLAWLDGRREDLEPLCAERGITAADYLAIGRAIESCRSIEAGLASDLEREVRLESTLPPPPGRPPIDSDVPSPEGAPSVVPPVVSLDVVDSLPGVPGRNLELFYTHEDEIERVLGLVEFADGDTE